MRIADPLNRGKLQRLCDTFKPARATFVFFSLSAVFLVASLFWGPFYTIVIAVILSCIVYQDYLGLQVCSRAGGGMPGDIFPDPRSDWDWFLVVLAWLVALSLLYVIVNVVSRTAALILNRIRYDIRPKNSN